MTQENRQLEDDHLMNFLAPWVIADDPQDRADFLAALHAALAQPASMQAVQSPAEAHGLTDEQIEVLFCEKIGIDHDRLAMATEEGFKACQWFKRGFRAAQNAVPLVVDALQTDAYAEGRKDEAEARTLSRAQELEAYRLWVSKTIYRDEKAQGPMWDAWHARAVLASDVQPKGTAPVAWPSGIDIADEIDSLLPSLGDSSRAAVDRWWHDLVARKLSKLAAPTQPPAPAPDDAKRQLNLNDQAVQKRLAAQWGYVQAPAPGDEKAAWVPYLSDRADGVEGHYAIARWNPAGYREVWNLRSHRWASASDDVLCLEEADSLLSQIVIPTVKSAPVPQAFTEGHCVEKRKPGGCQLHNLHCGYPACDRKAAAPSPAVAHAPITSVAGLAWSCAVPTEVLSWLSAHPPSIKPRNPLTEEQIVHIYERPELAGTRHESGTAKAIAIARAIERAHGIFDVPVQGSEQ